MTHILRIDLSTANGKNRLVYPPEDVFAVASSSHKLPNPTNGVVCTGSAGGL